MVNDALDYILGYLDLLQHQHLIATQSKMGRNKGKQCGEFDRKCQNAHHRQTVYVDRASDANRYRNPMQIGSGQGYRNDAHCNSLDRSSSGYWHRDGSAYGGGDKWSSIFSSSNRSSNVQSSSRSIAAATVGLSHLRHLLEDRRTEDRVHDRQHRLRLQRSRMLIESYNNDMIQKNTSTKSIEDRHEAGWLLSYDKDQTQHINTTNYSIPSLQHLAAQKLGPILPMYCASIGNEFVGESLKSVSADILSQLSISLAKNNPSDNDMLFATTDGIAKALAHSGVLSEVVLRGAPLPSLNDETIDENYEDECNDDARWLGDSGILSLCPKILPTENIDEASLSRDYGSDTSSHEHDDWEKIDFDIGLNTRMMGCFYLKRLELIDIPLRQYNSGESHLRGGISIQALREVLRSCSNITHLSLSNCFMNWETECLSSILPEESDNINMFLGANPSLTSLTHSIKALGKLNHSDGEAKHLLPQLLFHQMFENNDTQNGISGLADLLPELEVLDLSNCSWISPCMIIQFLLKVWERSINTDSDDSISSKESIWEEKVCGDEDVNSSINTSRDQTTSVIIPSLKHINIRGCTGLLPESSSLPSWLDEWRGHGLFNGIEVSTNRHERR